MPLITNYLDAGPPNHLNFMSTPSNNGRASKSSVLYSRAARRPITEMTTNDEISSDDDELLAIPNSKKSRGAISHRCTTTIDHKVKKTIDKVEPCKSIAAKDLPLDDDSSSDVELAALKARCSKPSSLASDSAFNNINEMINDSKSKLESCLRERASEHEIVISDEGEVPATTSAKAIIAGSSEDHSHIPKCTITVKASDSEKPRKFRISLPDPMVKVFTSYCTAVGSSPSSVKFFFEGQKILESSTPSSLDMEEDEEYQIGRQAERATGAPLHVTKLLLGGRGEEVLKSVGELELMLAFFNGESEGLSRVHGNIACPCDDCARTPAHHFVLGGERRAIEIGME